MSSSSDDDRPPLRRRAPGKGSDFLRHDPDYDRGPRLTGKEFLSRIEDPIKREHLQMLLQEDDEGKLSKLATDLRELRGGLSAQASQVYSALRSALQPHSRPTGGARIDISRDFYDNLQAQFPNSEVTARQIGTDNQWAVQINNGPTIFCSVRMEILTEEQAGPMMRRVMEQAKLVKSTLLDDNAKWKRQLQPGFGGPDGIKLDEFRRECAERSRSTGSVRGGGAPRQKWVVKGTLCSFCKRPLEEDQLMGQHHCKVIAQFTCTVPFCEYSWKSHQARLRPDGTTLLGQRCMKCQAPGKATTWRFPQEGERESQGGGAGQSNFKGMHQSDFCDACREFGNCMGIFFDPFIISTALSVLTGRDVVWGAYSEELTELLIADVDRHLRVALQPHVYVGEDENGAPVTALRERRGMLQRPEAVLYCEPAAVVKDAEGLNKFLATLGSDGGEKRHMNDRRSFEQKGTDFLRETMGLPLDAPSSPAQAGAARPADGTDAMPPVEPSSPSEVHSVVSREAWNVVPKMPMVDQLPKMRKLHYMRLVSEKVKELNGEENEKYHLAESILREYDGNLDKAIEHIQALTSKPTGEADEEDVMV